MSLLVTPEVAEIFAMESAGCAHKRAYTVAVLPDSRNGGGMLPELVLPQVIGSGEEHVAFVTFELFHGLVNSAPMPAEIAYLLEASAADLADVRTCVAVNARNVPLQLCRSRKRLRALGAFVRTSGSHA